MRRVYYRGKPYDELDKRSWVYGFYAEIPLDGGLSSQIFDGGEWIEVISRTVGEYVGLENEDNVKMYEGDIFEIINTYRFLPWEGKLHQERKEEIGVIEWDKGSFRIKRIASGMNLGSIELRDNLHYEESGQYLTGAWTSVWDGFKSIGNIHENPELLNPKTKEA